MSCIDFPWTLSSPIRQTQQDAITKLMDVLMLAVTGGRERSLAQYEALFEKGGFAITNILSTPTEFRILELKKKL